MAGLMACVQPLPRHPVTPVAAPTSTPMPAPAETPTAIPNTPLPPTPTPAPALLLEVQGPLDGSTLRGKSVVVHGRTNPGSAISVNGQPASVDAEGRFITELLLTEGAHAISVSAIYSLGELRTRVIRITLEPPQSFFLLVTEPADQTVVTTRNVRLGGRTGQGALVSVNGVSIAVDGQGIFSTTLTLDPGPNIIDVLSTSPDGQVLSAILAIIFRA